MSDQTTKQGRACIECGQRVQGYSGNRYCPDCFAAFYPADGSGGA